MSFLLDLDHVQAKKNKIHYESLIKSRTLAKKHRKRDLNLSDNSDSIINNLKQTSILNGSSKNKNSQVKNQRRDDNLAAREEYEKLCRQKHTQVT